MNSTKNIIASTILSAVLSVSGAVASHGEDGEFPVTMKPLGGVSFDLGAKRAAGYFLSESGQCKLTLVVADAMIGDEPPTDTPVRFDVAIDAGKDARFDTAEGKSLQFACAHTTQAVIVTDAKLLATYSPGAND